MRVASLLLLAWGALACLLMCAFAARRTEAPGDVTKIELVAARLLMFGGGAVGLVVILWQAAKILNS